MLQSKVVQAETSHPKKLSGAAHDKQKMKRLIDDISHIVKRLHDLLDSTIKTQMHMSVDLLLHDAARRYSSIPELEFLGELAANMRPSRPQLDHSC